MRPNPLLNRTARQRAMLASSVGRVFVRSLAFAALTAAVGDQNTVNYGTTRASKAMSEADIRAYLQARAACDRQSAAKQEQCRVELASPTHRLANGFRVVAVVLRALPVGRHEPLAERATSR